MAPTKISALSAATDIQNDDQFIIARSGSNYKVAGSVMAGLVWEEVLNLPLTTATGWTLDSGFSNDGSKMIIGVNSVVTRAAYQTRVPQDFFVVSIEIQLPSTSRSFSDQRAGIILNRDGSSTGAAMYSFRWNALSSATAYAERDAVAGGPNITIPGGLATNTWHKLTIVRSGMNGSFYANGNYIATSRIDSHAGAQFEHSYLALYGYQIDAWYRNLKVWRVPLPSGAV